VINIITYDPSLESVNTATARVGTQGYAALSAAGTGRIGDIGGIRLSAGGFRAQEFDPIGVSPGDLPFRAAPQRQAFSLDTRLQATSNLQVFLSAALVETHIWEATSCPFYAELPTCHY
jgi:outer membrane receptor for ferrienterochelin and colicins